LLTMAAQAASIEFAITNQFYLISKSAGLDYRLTGASRTR